MFRTLVHQLRDVALRRRVRRAVDAGIGVYNRTWPLSPGGPAAHDDPPAGLARDLGPQVLDWCRFAMGQMRKPYGLDYVTLVMSLIGAGDRHLAQVSFGVLRPQQFYGEQGVAFQLEETLARWEAEGLLSPDNGAETLRLATLLFSWGDLTRELLLAG